MEDKNIHSKIIKEIGKEILIPLGVFQKGTSRLYIDDNEYYFTVVEFQPSSFSRGTYLNIGITFLWKSTQRDFLGFGFPRKIAARYGDFIKYENEEQFRNEVMQLANIAKEEIMFYRNLRDIKFAKDWMIKYISNYGEKKYARFGLDLKNICSLNDDLELAKFYYENYYKEREKEELINYEELDKNYIISNIKATRRMWHSKPSMKKMPISLEYE
ncbi:MAG: hypothetical protein EOM50_05270 [Erysipelotrichia bacterium]|nr:hypothetical protein [Erysipelotrichia bacterium]